MKYFNIYPIKIKLFATKHIFLIYKTNVKNFFSPNILSSVFSFLFMFISIFFLLNLNYILNFQVSIFSLQELLRISLFFDQKRAIFSSLVCFITGIVFIYSIFYLSNQLNSRFIYLIFLFSFSILILILRGNLFIMILG